MFRIKRTLAPLAALAAGALIAAAPGPAGADPIVLPPILDVEPTLGCTQLVPHAVSVDNTPVRLDVRILLDGVPQAEAAKAVTEMRTAYSPLSIDVVATYQAVSFTGLDAGGLTQQAKDLYGGRRPAGVDVVYTMTSKDITSEGSPLGNNVAGLADCIGGVRYADRAFAVGERFDDPTTGGTIPLPVRQATGKTMAHEIGHLMGGHHHYASVEGLLAPDPNVMTLMGPTLSVIALKFSTLNTLMVKAHAQLYATP